VSKIRVLIVDDSLVARRALFEVLAGDPAIEVAGAAHSGRAALAKISVLDPDVMTLDVDMPDLSGLETLAEVRRLHPRLPVIMCSALTERGAAATLDALFLGAGDYVTKPSNAGSAAAAMARLRDDLIPKIKALCPRARAEAAAPPVASAPLRRSSLGPVDALVIGASTGGPGALAEVLPGLPSSFPAPVLIVQHMPPIFTRHLAERLAAISSIKVKEAADGYPVEPGVALLAPGDFHMAVERDGRGARVRTTRGPQENSCRPSADVLFRSAASAWGSRVLGVVLTGMGRDGEEGSARIKEAGGRVLVQDQASSVVWGMPGSVFRAGLADDVLALRDLPAAIVRRVEAGRRLTAAGPAGGR
jgi:two-component system chemotaxis response regulator CheB